MLGSFAVAWEAEVVIAAQKRARGEKTLGMRSHTFQTERDKEMKSEIRAGGMTAPEAVLKLSDIADQQDPYGFYSRLREQGRLHRVELPDGRKAWLVTGYDDIVSLLLDHENFSNRTMVSQSSQPQLSAWAAELMTLFGLIMSSSDPPDHTRLRSLVEKAFSRPLISELRPYIQQLSDELLDVVEERARRTGERTIDLVADYAFPLPAGVIMRLLGVPAADREKIRLWSEQLIRFDRTPQSAEELAPKVSGFIDYVKSLLHEKRAHPATDLLSVLTRSSEEGRLTDLELVSLTFQLIFGGHTTTSHLIGNGVLALLTHPDELKVLKREPGLIGSAIEELLRYDAPQQIRARVAAADTEIAGVRIRKGEVVLLALASGNRDPARFHAPDDLDICRQDNRHLSFGLGIHRCFGLALARLEAEIAILNLLQRMPNLRLTVPAEQLRWPVSGLHQRGLAELPLAF